MSSESDVTGSAIVAGASRGETAGEAASPLRCAGAGARKPKAARAHKAKADGPSKGHRLTLTFRAKVALSFVGVTLVTTLLLICALTIVWNSQFSRYTRENMENVAQSASTALANEYDQRGYWSTSGLRGILSIDDVFDGLGLQVLNGGGTLIYDNTWIGDSDISLAPDESSMVSKPIMSGEGKQVGTINVWAMGSDVLLTPRDINFRTSSLTGMLVTAGVALVLAFVLGLLFSRWLTRPLKRITVAADAIKGGDLTARSGVRGHDEIGKLGSTFDDMAAEFEKDRDLEKKLTNDVAHELRTPLQAIMATVEAMQDGIMPCDAEHLAVVDSEVKRLSRLVKQMLHLSRLESRSVETHFMLVDVVDFLYGIIASREAVFNSAGLELTFENRTGDEEFEAEIDPDLITQAVSNILQNANRYTPAPGKVTLGLEGDEDEVRISVADTGVGISRENIQRVFIRFWRADESRTSATSKDGLGVGLAVTKEIVDLHGGRIDVVSEVGKGTTFTLVLPRAHVEPEEEGQA